MLLAETTDTIPLSSITILRDTRQRREIDTSDIDASIRRNGVIQPVVIRPRQPEDPEGTRPGAEYVLVAGERRYTASVKAGFEFIPAVMLRDLPPEEARIVELEENVKRAELPWRDAIKAIGDLHGLYSARDPLHSQSDTAQSLSISSSAMSRALRVYRDLDSPRIARCTSAKEALNVLMRIDERAVADAVSDIMEVTTTIAEELEEKPEPAVAPAPVSVVETARQAQKPLAPSQIPAISRPRIRPAEESILNENFLVWAPAYTGPKFNLIHCDFPYGVEAFAGPMSGAGKWETYDDSSSTYWNLLKCLAANIDRLATQSAHMIFWFSLDWYQETLDFFEDNMPSWNFQAFPLIWHKSDNVGVLPDSRRGPRRVYETALFGSCGDRLILKPVSNLFAGPTDKKHHHSTKPEPMLRHFFQMVVDEHTMLFDPTCGSGSALRAAEGMGAKKVLGLEASTEHCENAQKALRSFRVLREASK